MEKINRKSGFYWILYADIWKVGEYNNKSDYWLLPGLSSHYNDVDFDYISEEVLLHPVLEKKPRSPNKAKTIKHEKYNSK